MRMHGLHDDKGIEHFKDKSNNEVIILLELERTIANMKKELHILKNKKINIEEYVVV